MSERISLNKPNAYHKQNDVYFVFEENTLEMCTNEVEYRRRGQWRGAINSFKALDFFFRENMSMFFNKSSKLKCISCGVYDNRPFTHSHLDICPDKHIHLAIVACVR